MVVTQEQAEKDFQALKESDTYGFIWQMVFQEVLEAGVKSDKNASYPNCKECVRIISAIKRAQELSEHLDIAGWQDEICDLGRVEMDLFCQAMVATHPH